MPDAGAAPGPEEVDLVLNCIPVGIYLFINTIFLRVLINVLNVYI